MSEAMHDPGGKVRLPLPAEMRGRATFTGPGDCYRLTLWREWGPEDAPFPLWIGMNPSTADATVDDPTVRREIRFTQSWGFKSYCKTNVSAYRATDPVLLRGVVVRHPCNHPTILALAGRAARVVLAFGTLKGEMRAAAAELVAGLFAAGIQTWCLGRTGDGSPRHPLYLPKTATLEEWKGWKS